MNTKHLIVISLLFMFIFANSRVAFVRPGALMRLSNHEPYNHNKLFSLALGSEITSLGDIVSHSSSFAFNKSNMNGTSWGLSYTVLPYTGIYESEADKNIDYEFGFHFQNKLYSTGKSVITAGVQDVLINRENINVNDLSIFINFANTLSTDQYTLTSILGAGSGKIAFDPHTQSNASPTSLGFYAGLQLNTPFLKEWGGIDLLTEIVHQGVNIGIKIPFTREYNLSIGITHIENLSDFSNQSASDIADRKNLQKDAPAICVGLGINIPKINQTKTKKIAQDYPVLFINGKVDSSLFNAGQYIYFLEDSLEILKQDINTMSAQNIALQLNNNQYRDSLNTLILESQINNNTQNEAMRYLSKSLRLYYQGEFKQALQKVEKAIELQPGIAVAYARKGSIYYKLNQIDRATLNWNIALKLDPEYDEVREMLNALKENKLKPISIKE